MKVCGRERIIDSIDFIDRPCLLIASRQEIMLIESVLIVGSKNDKKYCEQLAKSLDAGKTLRIISAAESSLPQKWMEDCWKRGSVISEFVRTPSAKDQLYLDLFYVLYSCKSCNWVFYRLRDYLFNCTGFKKDSELAVLLNKYLKKHRYIPNPFCIENKSNGEKYLSSSMMTRMLYTVLKEKDILEDKITERALRFQVIMHDLLSRRRYLSMIYSLDLFSQARFYLLNKKGESSSGCIFIHIQRDDESWFVKGNESPLFHCIENEIKVQKRILSKELNQHYLCMKIYDQKYKWIGYSFENKRTLRHILKERMLTDEERERLGAFLISTLDELYLMNIVHRDYRVENIMAEENEGFIKAFVLFDFGCSVMDGIDIWEKKTFWNKYLSEQVGGEGRYSKRIVDDAAAAYTVYMKCGGNPNDHISKELEKRIGRLIV